VLLILLASLGLTLAFRELPVDIGLDVSGPTPSAPQLEIAGEAPVPFQRTRFTTELEIRSFELVATGEKHPDAQSSEIWVQGFDEAHAVRMDPPGSWRVQGDTLVSAPDKQPSTLSWTGIGNRSLQFTAHPWSGHLDIRTGGQTERVDLYDADGGNRFIAIPPAIPTTRFHVQVPRRQLAKAAVIVHDLPPEQLHRLYVGTLIPRVFDALEGKRRHWGHVTEGWKPEVIEGRLLLGSVSALDRGGAVTFLALTGSLFALFGLLVLSIWAFVGIVRAANSRQPTQHALAPFSWRAWVGFAIPFAVTMTVAWLAYFPGQPSLDTWYQWHQIQTGNINNHHPAFHTLLIQGLNALWDTPASSVLFQLILLVASLASAFELLRRMRIPRWALLLAYVATWLSPHTTHMAIAVVKDTPYAAAILMLIAMLGTHVFSGRPARPRFWVSVGLVLALITLLRHNGILLTVGIGVLLPLFFWSERRRAMLALGSSAAALLLVYFVMYPLFGVRPRDFSHTATSFGWHVAAMIDEDVPLSAEEADFLDRVRGLDRHRWRYTPTSVAVTIWADHPRVSFNFPFADAHLGEFKRIHDSLMLRHPILLARHLARANAYLYMPRMPDDLNATVDIQFFVGGESTQLLRMRSEGHPMSPVFPELNQRLSSIVRQTVARGPLRWLLWMPAHYLYLAMLGLAIAILRTREWRLVLLFLPVLLNTASLALGVAQETRFQFPAFLTFGFFCALAALPGRGAAAGHVDQSSTPGEALSPPGPVQSGAAA